VEPIHLARRDRFALVSRIAGTLIGFVIIILASAFSGWSNGWVIGFFVFVIVGGALWYHLLTSIVRCPGCTRRLFNLRISSEDSKRKLFVCNQCGTTAWLREGFYWQREIDG
jgi:hypothetical protein